MRKYTGGKSSELGIIIPGSCLTLQILQIEVIQDMECEDSSRLLLCCWIETGIKKLDMSRRAFDTSAELGSEIMNTICMDHSDPGVSLTINTCGWLEFIKV